MSLVALLEGKDDDEVVKVLQRKMLSGHNNEATEFLRAVDPKRADTLRWKLVASLENIGKTKKKTARSGPSSSPKPVPKKMASSAEELPRIAEAGNGGLSKSMPAAMETSGSSSASKNKPKGRIVGERYQMGELLGKGGFARVYKALDLQTGEQLAIKEIQKDLLSKTELPKILNEGKVLAELKHNNIVKFVQLIMEKKQVYFVMEYISGGSLYHTMKRFGVFPESLVCMYMAQALLALEYLHAQNVLHRDIKGANLLVGANGRIKVADFGACTYAQLDKRLTVIGTPFWMAPEIIEMTSGGTAADIWSLGCTIIELLTGSPPYYTLGSMQALFRMVDDAHPPLPAGLSPLCRDFLLQCFIKDFARRPTATLLLEHEWIRKGISGKNNVGISPDQMQMTLRQHNQSKNNSRSIRGIDWGQGATTTAPMVDDTDVLERQAKGLHNEENSSEALEHRLQKSLKEKEKLAFQLQESRQQLDQLEREILGLQSHKARLELNA